MHTSIGPGLDLLAGTLLFPYVRNLQPQWKFFGGELMSSASYYSGHAVKGYKSSDSGKKKTVYWSE